MKSNVLAFATAAALLLSPALVGTSRAEVSEVRMATQFGIGAMPMIIMQRQKLLEAQAVKQGLPEPKVTWRQFPGGNPINEGILSGSLDIGSAGATVFITLWANAKGTPVAVRGFGAVSALPLYLNTRDPKVKSIKDLDASDKVAVTTLKVSVHAILLSMAAEKTWGPENSTRLDKLVVQLPHGDAAAAMISSAGEINNHFTAPPFQEIELKHPHIRRILTAEEILGGPATYMIAYATEKFAQANPKTSQAFVDALQEAQAFITKNPEAAAKIYLDFSKDTITVDEAVAIIKEKDAFFDLTPRNVATFAKFMAKQGITKVAPTSWQEMFFPDAQKLGGS